jgi:hypothetical protein
MIEKTLPNGVTLRCYEIGKPDRPRTPGSRCSIISAYLGNNDERTVAGVLDNDTLKLTSPQGIETETYCSGAYDAITAAMGLWSADDAVAAIHAATERRRNESMWVDDVIKTMERSGTDNPDGYEAFARRMDHSGCAVPSQKQYGQTVWWARKVVDGDRAARQEGARP